MAQKVIEQSDLLEGFSVVILRRYGLWKPINDYRATKKKSLALKLNIFLCCGMCTPYLIFQFMCLFMVDLTLPKLSFMYLNGLPGTQIFLKCYLYWIRFEEIATLYDLITKDFLRCIPNEKRHEARMIYRRISRRCNLFCFLAFATVISISISWIIMPGFDCGNGRYKIMAGEYPFPFGESPYFEIVFTYELFLMIWPVSFISLMQCVMILPLFALFAHFTVLNDYVASLRKDSGGRDKPDYLNLQLEAFIKDYNKLLRYSGIVKDVYNFQVSFILGSGTFVLIIGCLFFLYGEKDIQFTIKLMLFLLYEITEIAIICFSSSYIETTSSNLQFSVYQSDWYEADKKFKTAAQMTMLRAQRPVTLVAVKAYPINLETLIGIYQFVYTTCALLAKMKD